MRHIYILFAMLLILTACVDEFHADLPDQEANLLVVDGTIIADSLCSFYLSHTLSVNDLDEYVGENGAIVSVEGSDGSNWKATCTGDGEYQVQVGKLSNQATYQLKIELDGRTYHSQSLPPEETPELLDSITFIQGEYGEENLADDPKLTVRYNMTIRGERNSYYSIFYVKDWEVRSEWATQVEYNRQTGAFQKLEQSVSRGWKHEDFGDPVFVSAAKYNDQASLHEDLFEVSSREDYLSYRFCATIALRAISQEEYEYEKVRRQLSLEMGGLFSPQPSELPSNISCDDSSCKAIGFVGVAKNIQIQRLYINTNQVICLYNTEDYCQKIAIGADKYNSYYDMGYRVVNDKTGEWARGSCVDVRMRGASLECPSWWIER